MWLLGFPERVLIGSCYPLGLDWIGLSSLTLPSGLLVTQYDPELDRELNWVEHWDAGVHQTDRHGQKDNSFRSLFSSCGELTNTFVGSVTVL